MSSLDFPEQTGPRMISNLPQVSMIILINSRKIGNYIVNVTL